MGLYDNLPTEGDAVETPATPVIRVGEREEPEAKSIYDGLPTIGDPQLPALRSINLSNHLNPEKEAEAFKLSQERGIPQPLARQAIDKNMSFPSHNKVDTPAINKYLLNSPSNAAISREDIETGALLNVDRATHHDTRRIFNIDGSDPVDENDPFDQERLNKESEPTFSLREKGIKAAEIGAHNLRIGDLSYKQIWNTTEEREEEIKILEETFPDPVQGDNILEDIVIVSATMEPLIERSFVRGQEEALLFAPAFATWTFAMGQVPPFTATPEEFITVPVAGVIGYGAGVTFGAAETIFKQEAGLFYREALRIRDVNGDPINKDALKAAALGYAAISTGMEMIGLKYIAKAFPGGEKFLGKLTKPVAKKVLQNTTVIKALTKIGISLGKAVSVNALQEAGQESAAVMSEQLVKHYATNKDGLYFMPFEWKKAFRTRVVPAGEAGALGGFGWGTAGSVASVAKIGFDVTASNKFQQKVDVVQEEMEKLITKERSEAHAEQYLKATELKPDAYVDPEGIETLFQEDEAKAAELLTKIGIDPVKAREKAAIGQDSQVDLTLLHSKKLTQEEIDTVQKYLKPQPDSYTQKQLDDKAAVEEMELLSERWNEQTAAEDDFQLKLTGLKDQIVKAGVSEQFAQDNITLLEGAANNLALEGVDRSAFINSFTIRRKVFRRPTDASIAKQLNIKTDPKGEIIISEDETGLHHHKYLINIFQKGDESTVVHELLGHVFLEEMDVVSKKEGVSEGFKKDVKEVYKWVGAKEGALLNKEQKEKFARGYEQFLREGKAPSVQLSSVFARFKNFLKSIYSSARALNVKLTDEIRGVFGRLIDAENETRTAAALNGMVALTPNQMDAIGILPEKQGAMRQLVQAGMQKAESRLFIARDKAVKANMEGFRTLSEQEVLAEDVDDVYGTIDTIIEDGLQFDRDEYNEHQGNPNAYKFLPSKRITKKGGVTLEDTAFFFGFDSADHFVESISETLPKKTAIQNKVNEKVNILYNSFSAEDFITSTKEYVDYLAILGEELKSNKSRSEQATLTGESKKTIARKQIKRFARETLNSTNVTDARRPDLYLAAMKRASIAQSKFIKAQDWGAALKENEKVRLNHEMARLAVKNREFVKKSIDRSKTSARSKTIINSHREQIRAIMQRYKMSPTIAPEKPLKLVPLDDLLESTKLDDGFIASNFLTEKDNVDFAKRYQELTMGQYRDVDRTIKYLTRIGRQEFKDLLSDGVRKKSEVVDGSIEVIQSRPFKENKDSLSIMAGLSKVQRQSMSQLMGLDYIIKILGGTSLVTGELSFLEQNTTEKLKDVRDAQFRIYTQKSNELKPHADHIIKAQRKFDKKITVKGVGVTLQTGKLRVPGVIDGKPVNNIIPVPEILQDRGAQKDYFTSEQIFSFAFHRGSKSNINALLSGYPGLTLEQVDTLLNKFITVEDMRAVQAIRDIMETLRKPTEEVYLKMKNANMKIVEPQPYVFKGEEFDGGYYPINIDRNLAINMKFLEKAELKTAIESHDSKYAAPYAADGHTNERVDHKLPVDLSLIHMYRHFDKATKYITQAQTIQDVDKIITDSRFKNAVVDALGKEKYEELRPALVSFANPGLEGHDVPGNRMIRYLRSLATSSNLAFRAITAPKQAFSTLGAIHDMGKGKSPAHGFAAYMKGVNYVVRNASTAYNTMLGISDNMRKRAGKIDRDFLRPKFDKMKPPQRALVFGDREIVWDDAVNLGYLHIKSVDAGTVTPIWWGSYLDKLNEQGNNEQEAKRYADNIIQGSQPNVDMLTLPPWLRKGGFFSLFNIHQTFTVGIYGQRQRAYWGEWRAGNITTAQYAWFNFMDAFVPIITMQTMVAVLRGRDLEDKDTWLDIATGGAVQWMTMGLPIANAFFGAIAQGWRDVLEIPGAKTVEDTAEMFRKLGNAADGMDNKEAQRLFFSFLNVASDYARFPVGRLAEQAIKEPEFRGKVFGTAFEVKKKQKKTRRRRR